MTPLQVFTIAALGGLAALAGIVLMIALALGLFALIARIYDAHTAYTERRRTLAEARRQLDALPTTHHPKEKPR